MRVKLEKETKTTPEQEFLINCIAENSPYPCFEHSKYDNWLRPHKVYCE